MIIPTIHLNGTHPASLIHDLSKAMRALRAAREAVTATGPNARDYYVSNNPRAFEEARAQTTKQLLDIEMVIEELAAVYQGILDQRRTAT